MAPVGKRSRTADYADKVETVVNSNDKNKRQRQKNLNSHHGQKAKDHAPDHRTFNREFANRVHLYRFGHHYRLERHFAGIHRQKRQYRGEFNIWGMIFFEYPCQHFRFFAFTKQFIL